MESGVSGLARPRQWDATGIVEAPDLDGWDEPELEFVVLPDETVVGRVPPAAVPAFTEELGLDPPYRVVARRRQGRTWAVGAVGIEVAELPADTDGEELMLTVTEEGERELVVDGRPSVAGSELLEELAQGRHSAYVVRAARLRGTLWDVQIDPL